MQTVKSNKRRGLSRPPSIHANVPSGHWNAKDIKISRRDLHGWDERDRNTCLKYSYLCDVCRLPILSRHQWFHSDGNGTRHLSCELGRMPVRIEDSRKALAEKNIPATGTDTNVD